MKKGLCYSIIERNRRLVGKLTNQANLVVNLLKKLEQTLSPGQLSEVENLLAEMSVLYAIHQYKEIQDLKL